jgi:polyisoprenoid-binding protein YceI
VKRSYFVALALVAAPAIALPLVSTQAATTSKPGSASKAQPTTAQKQIKKQDSAATQRAKATQKLKAYSAPKGIGGTWAIDPAHSRIGFAVRHMMINDVHGQFNEFEGTIVVDEKDYTKSSVDFKAKVASIDTGVEQRDNHLRSADFFEVEKHPDITFKSTRIERAADGFRAIGAFTMKGVSKTIAIPFKVRGPVTDGFGYTRAGVEADLQINRQDYGIKYGQVIENVGLAIDNIVRINLDLEAVKAGTGPKKQ